MTKLPLGQKTKKYLLSPPSTPLSLSGKPSSSFFGKPSVGSRLSGEGSGIRMKGMLFKGDSVEQLGRKLIELRPDAAKRDKEGGWFSLEELRGKLKRLREIEEETAAAKFSSEIKEGGWFSLKQRLKTVLSNEPEVDLKVPVVVRLEGTNVDQGKRILKESGMKLITAEDLNDAADKAVKAASS